MGQRGSLEAIEIRKFSLPCPESNPDDDDDDAAYLTTACYTMEDYRKGYEGTSSQYGPMLGLFVQ